MKTELELDLGGLTLVQVRGIICKYKKTDFLNENNSNKKWGFSAFINSYLLRFINLLLCLPTGS